MPIITLLTDFGIRDEYVGLMKGVILSINPAVAIVDITHRIDSQDMVQAAYAIHSAYRYFPSGSVHLIVVDPGVGTGRSLLALEMGNQYFVAPDNGVLTLLFNAETITSLIKLTNSNYFLETVSHTFHGRDIIAPVGAHLTRGVKLHKMGDEIPLSGVIRLENIHPRVLDTGEITGIIVAIDHFGNLITNIDFQMLAPNILPGRTQSVRIRIGSHSISGIGKTYQNGAPNTPLALIGSRGYLEVAVNRGSAAVVLNACKGDTVQVKI
jgi:S-adenosylmethionine hydrolase